MKKAIILTDGLLSTPNAKTAHGLIRDSQRYSITAVIDPPSAGQDAGVALDGKFRNVPIFDSVEAALAVVPGVTHCIVGVATVGGTFPPQMLETLKIAIQNGLSVVNGLHDFLSERADFVALAERHGVSLLDVRRPKKRSELHFWTGEIFEVKAPIVAVLGMDCALGKRTAARLLVQACRAAGIAAEMIYTGQTGWLQGGKYGFIFDSTLNDFISGELENAIVTCWRETGAEVIFLEGQSSLRNPSGPCGSEFLVSGNAKYVVLVHAPKQEFFEDEPHWGKLPTVESEVALIEQYGSKVIALALNTRGCSLAEALDFQREYERRLGVPVLLPLEEGVEKLFPTVKAIVSQVEME